MKRYIAVLLLFVWSLLSLQAQEDKWRGLSVDMLHGKLQVSENGRYLQHKDGTPFFYLGDTAWELFHRLNEQEVETYLENRRAKGFTVIQAVILAELDGLNVPNRYGDTPLKDIREVVPNELYFKWVDKVIRMAEAKGLYIGLLPTWGDKVDKEWGVGPEIFNPAYAQAYGAWLGNRYKHFKNIIWINGGDRWGGDGNYPIWDALAKGIKSKDKNHLVTFHPLGENTSGQWFHNNTWLDFNMSQTGHCQRNYEVYERILVKDYNRFPVKPCIDGEPRYENHPVCWKPDSLGWFDDVDVRQAMYWSLLSGAFGHTYGCHDIWQFKTAEREAVGLARGDWESSLDLAGAYDLIHARRLMERFDWESRVPANEMIVSENTSFDHKIVALRGDGYALVYFPNGENATIDINEVSKKQELQQEWLNPRTGELTSSGSLSRGVVHKIVPPSSGRGNDWILIVRE
ncbi:hypothetical protein M2463_002244 [Parabacteroides sp. PH5-13]|uniref:glycoside hydrolase family 140 protein n=1 Tax=unclassified Parabacteroides TaxID=2649774 RepID=UPI0024731FDD|nr:MULTISPECIES: glycoside hydrolase family 140 protein [unclassified Parabacteroides]MDH6305239.1 hypothetical protein [Parabacteroides sp. PH5-39]MDH6320228.1 hypothetical protein [Parabacteroides sp. PH5-13]MDH6323829.1 hypothetical protein [Parabacteroides sp. PH5-8]MDH6384941.1 hypothetical protein [Parabacteroides sp. PH5-17]MDH6394425.1 hypothetical protein [Parabacteroides sp. PFB2-22]